MAYENGEEEPVIIPGVEWEELWPVFNENRAMRLKVYDPIAYSPMTGGLVHSAKRYEAVRISWDDRRGAGQADLELLLVSWLEKQPRGLPKKQLAKEAREHFGSVTERIFNRAYTHVFKRSRGRPRLKK